MVHVLFSEIAVEKPSETPGEKGIAEEGDRMEVDPPQQQSETSTTPVAVSKPRSEWAQRLVVIDKILGGGDTVAFHQEFLIRNNRTDLQILKNTKVSSVDVALDNLYLFFF